jgi:hypothetical protein
MLSRRERSRLSVSTETCAWSRVTPLRLLARHRKFAHVRSSFSRAVDAIAAHAINQPVRLALVVLR